MAKWTEERRKRQAEAIKRWKPWEKSTGPKTKAGKKRSCMNAYKHGFYTLDTAQLRELLRHNRAFLKLYKQYMLAHYERACHKNELLKTLGKSDD